MAMGRDNPQVGSGRVESICIDCASNSLLHVPKTNGFFTVKIISLTHFLKQCHARSFVH